MTLKSKYFFSTICVGLVASLIACQPSKDKESSASQDSIPSATTGFKPNPQRVAEVEVKTLGIGSVAPPFKLPDGDDLHL
jgi:hypothetical protein